MSLVDSKKPILTSYVAPYNPKEEKLVDPGPYKMVGKNFSHYGTILFYPENMEYYEIRDKPIKARFVSGHFYFTLGIHCQEYKYDPQIYFAGDEISLSIRSYTLGYDIYHPHKTILWHEYTREYRMKHWDDFQINNKINGKVNKLRDELDNESKKRLRHLLKEEDNNIDLGIYCLGNVRTHKDYEKYAEINFKLRRLHPDTIKGIEPPASLFDWSQTETDYNYTINIPKTEKFNFIFIGFEDNDGDILYRKDLFVYQESLSVSFSSYKKPYKWV